MKQQLINKDNELSEKIENLNKQIDDYKTRINNYELKIQNMTEQNNKLKKDLVKFTEENEKLKLNNAPQQNVIIFLNYFCNIGSNILNYI